MKVWGFLRFWYPEGCTFLPQYDKFEDRVADLWTLRKVGCGVWMAERRTMLKRLILFLLGKLRNRSQAAEQKITVVVINVINGRQ